MKPYGANSRLPAAGQVRLIHQSVGQDLPRAAISPVCWSTRRARPRGYRPDFAVHVGKRLAHPNEPGHHVESIELYKGHVLLARADLAGGLAEPKATFTVMLESDVDDQNGGLRAFEKCNLHGTWESTKAIEVS